MGAGFKDFASGAILTAGDVDNYLMRQTVMTFADASARDTALSAVLDEGMVAYLEDTDTVTVYDGSAWNDITGKRIIYGGQNSSTTGVAATGSPVLHRSITPTAPVTGYIYVIFTGNTGFNAFAKDIVVVWGTTSAASGSVNRLGFHTSAASAAWAGVATHYRAAATSGSAVDVGLWVKDATSGGTTYLDGVYHYWWLET